MSTGYILQVQELRELIQALRNLDKMKCDAIFAVLFLILKSVFFKQIVTVITHKITFMIITQMLW